MKLTSTTKAQPLHVQAMPRSRRLYNELLIALLLVSVALIPRISGLADFLTTDEAYHWIERTERFSAALAAGRWAETIQTGHPGVSLMWLGSLGMQLERWVIGLGWAVPPDRLGHLAWLRLVPAIFHSLALLLGYAMLGRLLRPAVALVAALLWATSPYLVAHGRLLHLDGLLTDFVTLALLAALVASQAPRPLPWLVAAGAATGLALLTKGPALISLPVLGLTLFALGQGERRRGGDKETSRRAAEASALPRSSAPPLPRSPAPPLPRSPAALPPARPPALVYPALPTAARHSNARSLHALARPLERAGPGGQPLPRRDHRQWRATQRRWPVLFGPADR